MPSGIYTRTNYHRKINSKAHTGLGKHGHTFGRIKTRTYRSYDKMKQRCLNPNNPRYKDWGGRGIKICDRWLGKNGFINFLADMGERPPGKTIDRKDNDGDYTPKNCKWSTPLEQMRNQRRSASKTHAYNL